MSSGTKSYPWALLALSLCLAGTAQAGNKHPGYLRARDDLRLARVLLQRANSNAVAEGSQDEVSLTIANIDDVLAEIDKETGPERKKSHALPKVNARLTWPDRLSESLRLLEKAQLECSKEKDTAGDPELPARVNALLGQSHTRIIVALETKNFDYNARNLPTRND